MNLSNKPYIFLDTNFVQYSLSQDIGPKVQDLVEKYKENFTLAVSNISIFECAKTAEPKRLNELLDAIKDLKRFEIDEKVLELSAYLHNFYERDENSQSASKNISTEDKIIAASVIFTDSTLLTGDFHGFPRPFFKEEEYHYIYFTRNKRRKIQVIYKLLPDRQVIDHWLAHSREPGQANVMTRNWENNQAKDKPKI